MEWQEVISAILVPALITVITAIATWAGKKLVDYLQTQIDAVQNSALRAIADEALEAASLAVRTVAQVATNDLKAAAANGKLTGAEARAAFEKALSTAWNSLTEHAKQRLVEQFGEHGAREYIGALVETEVLAVNALLPKAERITSEDERERVALAARAKLGLR